MSGLSSFQKKKLLHVFNVFFDINKSGEIDKNDFDLAIDRICSMRGWAKGSPHYNFTEDTLNLIWSDLQKKADANQDNKVTREEWFSMWEECCKPGKHASEWQNRYMDFMFDLEDTSGDGLIDETEYTSVYTNYGLSAGECKSAFNKFSQDNSVKITKEVFADLWKDYFMSDDKSAPGNYLFGTHFLQG